MSDFRRLRDWTLMDLDGVGINGGSDHPKRDLNSDGVIASQPVR